jgi:hypothetical protein
MRPTGRYRCTGCEVVFSSPQAWRDGLVQPQAPEHQALDDQRAAMAVAR